MSTYATLNSDEIIINDLQSEGGTVDPTANIFYVNSSILIVGNGTLTTSITPKVINTNVIFVGDSIQSNITITQDYISISGSSTTNTYIDSNKAIFSGSMKVQSGISAEQLFANSSVVIGNTDGTYTVINTTTFSGTANNTSYVGSVTAANVVSNSQLQSNLGNYQTTAGLASNVATLSANNASYLGTVAAAFYVQNTDTRTLSGNLTFTGYSTFTGNVVLNSVYANGSYGTTNQILTSNGSTVYWSSPGAVSVNTAAQYTWTNTHTFSNVVTFNANLVANTIVANGALGASSQVLTSNSTGGVYWAASAGGGATGGSTDKVFYENDITVTSNYTLTTNKNAMTAGPVTINSGVVITVPSGSVWTIV